MSYDPRRRVRSKRSRVPPQLRAWVFGRRRRRADPSRRRVRRRRYDPSPPRRRYARRYDPQNWGRVRARAKGWGAKLGRWMDKLSLPLGSIVGIFNDPWAGGRLQDGTWLQFMQDRILGYKADKILPAIKWSFSIPTYRDSYYAGIGMGIGGSILKALNLHPVITKVGKFIRNFGIGLGVATFLASIIWLPAAIASPPKGYQTGNSNPSNPTEAPYG